ncbi:hypothetical protein WOLCODRAFT_19306 [Wolfiporia cocos MD-104 SS10]|uniref:Uncharacterized protein n=1 Tax=Wolfiporia cocos (strain MD-104) TaxID=742152 RepID=A0A2H3K4B0_WOLCO|nr:hypothetical protein WOLCODRAFT_19306 [Wolfiporia cocos MD-104 SS10]
MARISLPHAHLASAILESVLYGTLLMLAGASVAFLAKPLKYRLHHAAPYIFPMFIVTLGILIISTIHWSLSIVMLFRMFASLQEDAITTASSYSTHSRPFFVASVCMEVSCIIVADALLIYRLWIIWDRRLSAAVFPICSLTGCLSVAATVEHNRQGKWLLSAFIFEIWSWTLFFGLSYITYPNLATVAQGSITAHWALVNANGHIH